MSETSFQRLDFEPDGIPTTSASSPSAPVLSSSTALARFEFEPGRANEGTKILMVEWEDDADETSSTLGDWEVSWEGKSTVLPAGDRAGDKLHRIYFMLAPGITIPPVVKLAQQGGKVIQINPLPAIFPAELGASATAAGKLGVLHTVWAKKRLSVLQKEIDLEMKTNGEGIGLEIALQEKQWIEENFGVGAKPVPEISSPTSPKTPGGGRLSEKLKGLKLGTSASVLSGPPTSDPPRSENNPLSPDLGDVAVSSFALFHSASASRPVRAIVQNPPDYLVAKQSDSRSGSRINSLDAVTSGDVPRKDDNDTEDGLFAVRLSPRSPEMTKSPFSFAAKDTAPWMKETE